MRIHICIGSTPHFVETILEFIWFSEVRGELVAVVKVITLCNIIMTLSTSFGVTYVERIPSACLKRYNSPPNPKERATSSRRQFHTNESKEIDPWL